MRPPRCPRRSRYPAPDDLQRRLAVAGRFCRFWRVLACLAAIAALLLIACLIPPRLSPPPRKELEMRPLEYRDYLVDVLKNTPDVQRVDVLEGGPYPYALTVTAAGREQRWQVIGQLADGAKHDSPTPAVTAGPPAFASAPVGAAPDAWLGGVIGAAEPADTKAIEVWSAREGKSDAGLTVFFHNGERAFVRLV